MPRTSRSLPSWARRSSGRFKSVRRPTAPRVTELRLFMQMMGVNPALLEVAPDTALAELQAAIAKETAHTLSVLSKLGGAMLAGQPLWEGHELTGLQRQLSDYKDFLDRVSSINSTGKLKQFKASGDDIKRYAAGVCQPARGCRAAR